VDARSGTRTTLAGRYELVEMVGYGGMAQVWRSYDRELRRQVAVKVLSVHPGDDSTALQRFRREGRHVAALSHPNIVPVYDFGIADGRTYLVMAYIDGPSLRDLLSPALGVAPTAQLAVDVLAALDHAHHRGIVHRDIKPANILMTRDGTALLADFGVARASGDTTELTAAGSFVGTATYASPEQCNGTPVGPASDLYSVGCVLYRCLAGRPPFEADDAGQLVLQHRFADAIPILEVCPETPPALAAVIQQAMAKEPEERFADAGTMRDVLAPFAGVGLQQLVDHWSHDQTVRRSPDDSRTETLDPPYGPEASTGVGEDRLPSDRPSGMPKVPTRGFRTLVALLMVVGAVVLGAVTWEVVIHRSGNSGNSPSVLPSGGTLQAGQSLAAPNRRFELTMQSDGNLVEYLTTSRSPRWESGTSGNFGAYAVVQADGDFVVYPKGMTSPPPGTRTPALWSSGTYGHPGSSVVLQNNGALSVRAADHGSVLWTNH